MIRLSLTITAGIAAWLAFSSWKMGLVAALATMVWSRGIGAPAKTIFLMDHATGEMKPQSLDSAALRYLKNKE